MLQKERIMGSCKYVNSYMRVIYIQIITNRRHFACEEVHHRFNQILMEGFLKLALLFFFFFPS